MGEVGVVSLNLYLLVNQICIHILECSSSTTATEWIFNVWS